MDATGNSKQLQTFDNKKQYTFHYLFTPKANDTDIDKSDVPLHGEHSFENNSDSDSSSEVDGNASDDEMGFDELLYDGKTMNKIEVLAAMIGVDTKEPAVVLTEVVRVLKLLKESKPISHYY
ncbi:unnamed protein product [Vicia faba]|uniref:Uncharacterized protein n=1 Tax=Vicia faba TaxID=3906 RepID=A0AAV0YF88_VICFA|nr:unnamed protein product [Vicia faba]